MYIYIYIHTYTDTQAYINIHDSIHIYIHTYIHTYTLTQTRCHASLALEAFEEQGAASECRHVHIIYIRMGRYHTCMHTYKDKLLCSL